MNKNILSVLYVFLAVLVAGCQGARDDSGLIEHETLDKTNKRAELVLASESLVGKVNLAKTIFRQVNTFQQAQVTVQNLTDNRLKLEYQIKWKDTNGFIVSEDRQWHSLILDPHEVERMMSTSQRAGGYSITMTIRLPKSGF